MNRKLQLLNDDPEFVPGVIPPPPVYVPTRTSRGYEYEDVFAWLRTFRDLKANRHLTFSHEDANDRIFGYVDHTDDVYHYIALRHVKFEEGNAEPEGRDYWGDHMRPWIRDQATRSQYFANAGGHGVNQADRRTSRA